MAELSLVIPCLNGYDTTKKCMDFIIGSDMPEDTEIIVIDDGSHDKTKGIEKSYECITHTVRHRDTVGFAPSTNHGMYLATGDYIAIFNNDVMVPRNWWTSIKASEEAAKPFFEDKPYKLGMLGLEVISPRANYFNPAHKITFAEWKKQESNIETPRVANLHLLRAGGPWIMKREAVKDVGYLDERFVPGLWEDIDYFVRMCIHGWMWTCIQGISIYHFHSKTMGREYGDRLGHIYTGNKNKFCEKWGVNPKNGEIPDIDWAATLEKRELIIVNEEEEYADET